MRKYWFSGMCGLLALCAVAAPSTAAVNCPGTITADYPANEDLMQNTANADCFYVNGSNITINLGHFNVICNNAAGCGYGVRVSNTSSNVTVKNGRIIPGAGAWASGIENGISGGAAVTTTVTNVSVFDTMFGVVFPYKVQNSVFKGISTGCIASLGYAASNGLISQNFCSSAAVGLNIKGGATAGTSTTIERNYVRAVSDGIDTASGGYAAITHNVIDAGSPLIDPGANSTLSENLCDSATLCPDPDSNFSLTLGFD